MDHSFGHRYSSRNILPNISQSIIQKVTVLVTATVVEIFYQELASPATVLVIPTVLELFYQELASLATVLVIPTVLEFFLPRISQSSYSFGHSYSNRNSLPRICQKIHILVIPTVIEILNPLRRPRGFRQCRAPSWFFSLYSQLPPSCLFILQRKKNTLPA